VLYSGNAKPSSAVVQQCFGGTYRLYLQDRTITKHVTTKKEGALNVSLTGCLFGLLVYPKDNCVPPKRRAPFEPHTVTFQTSVLFLFTAEGSPTPAA
jgi:hypothetical protein